MNKENIQNKEEVNTKETTSEPVITKVTKHPGRVAAGKRLAEWNRNKKINEQTKKQIVEPNEEEPVEKTLQTSLPETKSSKSSGYIILTISAVGASAFGYLFYKQYIQQEKPTRSVILNKPNLDKEIPKPKQQQSINPDPFIMH